MSGQDGDDVPTPADSEEKTAAFSLDDIALEEDEGEKTAAMSLSELGLSAPEPLEPGGMSEPEDEGEKTAAISLEEMGIVQGSEPPQGEDTTDGQEEEGDKTAAFSLEDLGFMPDEEPTAFGDVSDAGGEEEEEADKTAAFSLEEMGLVEGDASQEAPSAAPDDEEGEDKTAALSLEEMGILEDSAPSEAPPQGTPETDALEDKTAALSLEEMGVAPSSSGEEAERTEALSIEDMGIDALEEEEEEDPTEAMPSVKPAPSEDEERTAAMSLDEMELGDEERTAAMSLDDMGLEEQGPPPPELEIRKGNDRGESFVVRGESVVVGRGLDCDIVLNDASVSRKHFRLDKTSTGYRMVDLESGNGTKVNGVRLSQFDLAHGTVLEAGTTTMAWRQLDKPATEGPRKEGWDDNAESTRVSNLAAMSVLPEWADQVKQEDKAKVTAAQRGPLKMVVMLLSIIIALVLGFAGLDKALNMGIIFDDGSAAEADMAAAEAKREAIKLMNAGREAFSEREWSRAKKKFKAALELDDEVREGKRYLKKTKAEATAFKALRRGRTALDNEEYEEAIAQLSKIDDSSLYYSDDGEEGEGAVDLLTQAVDAFVEAKLLESQRLEEGGDARGALAAIEQALKVAPDDPSIVALRAELAEEAESQAEAPTEAKSAASKPPQRAQDPAEGTATAPKRRDAARKKAKADKAPAAPSKVAGAKAKSADRRARGAKEASSGAKASKKSSGLSAAMSSYGSGDFSKAIDQLNGLSKRGSRKAKAKAKRLAAAVERFKNLYTPAMVAAKSFRSPSKTVKSLREARKLDASINGAYSKRIRKELARQLVFQAKEAWSNKKYGKAGRHARQALALDPKHPQAKKIYAEVRAEAQGWFDQAKSAASSNPDKAMQLLSRVVSIFPRGDPRYKEAYKLLNQLAAEEED